MKVSDLSRSLGISRQMTYRLKNQGMPTDSLEAAITWRKRNIDPFKSKSGRIGGNSGTKYQPVQVNKNTIDHDADRKIVRKVLTHIVPQIWFDKIGVLASITADCGVKISAESFLEIQQASFLMYLHYSDEYLQSDAVYKLPDAMLIKPGHKGYASLIEQLNKILRQPEGRATGRTHQKHL